jgi:hypothetical protein
LRPDSFLGQFPAMRSDTTPVALPPLTIILKREHFDAFADGSKCDEIRRFSQQFNLDTCRTGRAVRLRLGYAADAPVLTGRIRDVSVRSAGSVDGFLAFARGTGRPMKRWEPVLLIHLALDRPRTRAASS